MSRNALTSALSALVLLALPTRCTRPRPAWDGDAGAEACSAACEDAYVCRANACAVVACQVDEECASGERCVDRICSRRPNLCEGLSCPSGQACAKGACYPTECDGRPCAGGEVCEQGACRDLACVAVPCPAGTTCVRGACFAQSCGDVTCAPDEVCNDGCKEKACVGVVCPSGQACAKGLCYPTACGGVACRQGEVCEGGTCRDRTCLGVQCPSGHACAQGTCHPTSCGGTACGAGLVCEAGGCREPSCVGVRCSAGVCRSGSCTGVPCSACNPTEHCIQGSCAEALQAPAWLAPLEGAVLPLAPVAFDWEDVPGALGYRLQLYRHDGAAWQSIRKLDLSASLAQEDLTLSGAGFFGAWLWAEGTGGRGPPSPRTFSLFPPPTQATNLSPGGWSQAAADPPSLSWTTPAGMCGYRVTVFGWDGAKWAQVAQKQGSEGASVFTPPPLGPGFYYWSVELGTPVGWSAAASAGFRL